MERIGLKEAVGVLRKELSDSIKASSGEELRFKVGEVTLEFQVEVERAVEGSGGIKFWVVNLGSKASSASAVTHKITLPLSPVTERGEPVLTGSSDEVPE